MLDMFNFWYGSSSMIILGFYFVNLNLFWFFVWFRNFAHDLHLAFKSLLPT